MGRKIGSIIGFLVFAIAGIYAFTQSKPDSHRQMVHNKILEIESSTFDFYEAANDRSAQAALLEDGANQLRQVDVSSLSQDDQMAFARLAEAYSRAATAHKANPVDEAKRQASLEEIDKAKANFLTTTNIHNDAEATE